MWLKREGEKREKGLASEQGHLNFPLKDVTSLQLVHSRRVEQVLARFALARPYALLTEKVKNCVQTGHESCPGFQTAPSLTSPRVLFRLFFVCYPEFIGIDSVTAKIKNQSHSIIVGQAHIVLQISLGACLYNSK